MPKKSRNPRKGRPRQIRERHLSVRSERRAEPDIRKLARAVVSLALAQAEADAQAEKARRDNSPQTEEMSQ